MPWLLCNIVEEMVVVEIFKSACLNRATTSIVQSCDNLKSWQVYFIIIDRTINLRFLDSQYINFGVEYKKFEIIQMCK